MSPYGRKVIKEAEALEQLSPDQRKQALEQALSRMFGGADLDSVDVDIRREEVVDAVDELLGALLHASRDDASRDEVSRDDASRNHASGNHGAVQ
jgi:hypothetical protein